MLVIKIKHGNIENKQLIKPHLASQVAPGPSVLVKPGGLV
jgi:hypothetical protein